MWEQRGVKDWLESFADEIERSAADIGSRGRGGQQVGPSSADFAHCPPSAIGRLRWWLRELRSAFEHDETERKKGGG